MGSAWPRAQRSLQRSGSRTPSVARKGRAAPLENSYRAAPDRRSASIEASSHAPGRSRRRGGGPAGSDVRGRGLSGDGVCRQRGTVWDCIDVAGDGIDRGHTAGAEHLVEHVFLADRRAQPGPLVAHQCQSSLSSDSHGQVSSSMSCSLNGSLPRRASGVGGMRSNSTSNARTSAACLRRATRSTWVEARGMFNVAMRARSSRGGCVQRRDAPGVVVESGVTGGDGRSRRGAGSWYVQLGCLRGCVVS